jgi:hypothetical protein
VIDDFALSPYRGLGLGASVALLEWIVVPSLLRSLTGIRKLSRITHGRFTAAVAEGGVRARI